MSALSQPSSATSALDNPQTNINNIDHQLDQQLNNGQHVQHQQQQQPGPSTGETPSTTGKGKQRRSSPIPRIRRACLACHQGKTRCSEVLPCQSCLKRGIGESCTYPDPDNEQQQQQQVQQQQQQQQAGPSTAAPPQPFAAPAFGQIPPPVTQFYPGPQPGYYPPPDPSAFRPLKRSRPLTDRPLTEEETAAIQRFQRGDFYVGQSAPVRIDPRLPVRLSLGEGDHVHFIITEAQP